MAMSVPKMCGLGDLAHLTPQPTSYFESAFEVVGHSKTSFHMYIILRSISVIDYPSAFLEIGFSSESSTHYV